MAVSGFCLIMEMNRLFKISSLRDMVKVNCMRYLVVHIFAWPCGRIEKISLLLTVEIAHACARIRRIEPS